MHEALASVPRATRAERPAIREDEDCGHGVGTGLVHTCTLAGQTALIVSGMILSSGALQ